MAFFVALVALVGFCEFGTGAAVLVSNPSISLLSHNRTVAKGSLRGISFSESDDKTRHSPCHCKTSDQSWVKCNRTEPKCIFIDLGAGTGSSFEAFLQDKFGPVKNCPSGQWEAVLVEANPMFNKQLEDVAKKHSNGSQVHLASSTAAYMCEATTSFYLDTKDVQTEYWDPSSPEPQALESGLNRVAVNTMNLNRVLTEKTTPGDWVMVKMDIEGAEFDIIPCLAEAPAATLIDRLYLEQHDPSWGLEGATPSIMQTALAGLRTRGVDIPAFLPPEH